MTKSEPFEIISPPDEARSIVFSSPHSGRNYQEEFITASRLDPASLRKSEDFEVDILFGHVAAQGATLIKALFPRAFLDVNREPYELDPKMFDGPLPRQANTSSIRVNSGLGTIARIVSENEEIYSRPLSVEEGIKRIETLYFPYHAALNGLLLRAVQKSGYAVLIDCHSMPSNQTVGRFGSLRNSNATKIKSDIVLGNRYGNSCSPFLTHAAAELLEGYGYQVSINKPYAGGFITAHYGRPQAGFHALQIEINRSLYMNESKLVKSAGFQPLAQNLERFTADLINIVCTHAEGEFRTTLPFAAE